MILNNESCPGMPEIAHLDDAGHWHPYIENYRVRAQIIAEHFRERVAAYQIWNEPDHAPDPPRYTPTVRAHFYGRMLQHAYQAIKVVSERPAITAGMVTGNPGWVRDVMASTGNHLFTDALAVHPYGQRPFPDWPRPDWGFGLVTDLISRYHAVVSKPIWITEFGNWDMDAQASHPDGGIGRADDVFPLQMLDAVNMELAGIVSHFFWFCWSNGMVPPFGLHEASGERKASYFAFHKFATLPTNDAI